MLTFPWLVSVPPCSDGQTCLVLMRVVATNLDVARYVVLQFFEFFNFIFSHLNLVKLAEVW
jgi:hypothetical protein